MFNLVETLLQLLAIMPSGEFSAMLLYGNTCRRKATLAKGRRLLAFNAGKPLRTFRVMHFGNIRWRCREMAPL
jgi:hypothetical protein